MKKIFSVTAMLLFFASIAWSQGSIGGANNQDVMHANFEAQVTVPIQISDPGTILIGDIAPGTTRNMNLDAYRMQFNISGASNWNFAVTGTLDQAGSGGDCWLIADWQYWANGVWNTYNTFPWHLQLDGNGNYSVACFPRSLYADAAAGQGPRSFTVTLTATYEDM